MGRGDSRAAAAVHGLAAARRPGIVERVAVDVVHRRSVAGLAGTLRPVANGHEWFRRWSADGTFTRVLAALRLCLGADGLLDLDTLLVDSTPCAPQRAPPTGRKKPSASGAASWSASATTRLSSSLCEQVRRPRQLVADRGYDGQRCRRRDRPPRIKPGHYARRNVLERCFGSLKEHRRVATRYDKHDTYFVNMVSLACIRRILQHHFRHCLNTIFCH